MQPIVNGLDDEFGEQLAFEQRNAGSEDVQAMMRTYGLRGHPSYVIVDETGKALWSVAGEVSAEMLRGVLSRHTDPE